MPANGSDGWGSKADEPRDRFKPRRCRERPRVGRTGSESDRGGLSWSWDPATPVIDSIAVADYAGSFIDSG